MSAKGKRILQKIQSNINMFPVLLGYMVRASLIFSIQSHLQKNLQKHAAHWKKSKRLYASHLT